jgi:predicted nucleic acid-binding protein
MRAYLDSCVCVYLVEQPPGLGNAIRERIRERRPTVCWTLLTRLECRVKPLKMQALAVLQAYETFFRHPGGIFLDFQRTTFDLATELRVRHGLKVPDALHLAAAIEGGCEEFWTNDHRLDKTGSHYLKTVTF